MKNIAAAVLSSGIFALAPVYAQTHETEAQHAQVFTPIDFTQFAPRTALDMVSQIPGFSISGGDGGRGFGQASQNVLINGQRISSKSTSSTDALSRIPAQNVIQIELVEGASLDIPGLNGQVVNVTTRATGLSGTWTYRARFRENLPPALDWFEVALNGAVGNINWTLGVESEPGRGTNSGRENIFDGARNLTEYREEEATFINSSPSITGALTWTRDNGDIANLNGRYAIFEFNEQEHSNSFMPDGTPLRQTVFQFAEDEWNSEISGDYETGFGPGRLKFIGLQRNEHSPTRARFFGGAVDGSESIESIFDRTVDESESILRGEYSWQTTETSDWQVSLEGAFNSLESEASLFEGEFQEPLAQITLGTPFVKVEEERAEAFVTHGRQLSENVRLQASVGVEQSEITSDGATGQTRKFTRPKGSIAATWEANEQLTLNATLERRVGQLDFFDFVSNVDLNQGDNQTGNVDIVPEQSWRLEVQAERDFGAWGALTATVFNEEIEDIADQIPIGTGEGPGNLHRASRSGIELEGTFQFDKLGWEGAQLTYEAEYNFSDVDDPLTGISRRLNGEDIYDYELEFRRDIPNTEWAWGLTYRQDTEAKSFRVRTINQEEKTPGFLWGYIEHKNLWGMTGSIFLANITDQDDQFTRVLFDPNRTGQVVRIEDRTRNFGNILTLRLKGAF